MTTSSMTEQFIERMNGLKYPDLEETSGSSFSFRNYTASVYLRNLDYGITENLEVHFVHDREVTREFKDVTSALKYVTKRLD